MRLLFFLLVISNLAIVWFAFQQPAPDKDVYAQVNLPRVSHLQMLSEVSREPTPDDAVVSVVPEIKKSPDAPQDADPSDRIELDSRQLPPPLLSDLFLVPDDGGVPFLVDNLEPLEARPKQCVAVSGFADREQTEKWLAQIEDTFGVEGELRNHQVARDPLHWVIVPPTQTRAERVELFNALQRRGIDSYMITQGEQANAISLGLFESRRAAEAVMHARRQAGIDAVLTVYPRFQEELFVTALTDKPQLLIESLPENVEADVGSDACQVLH